MRGVAEETHSEVAAMEVFQKLTHNEVGRTDISWEFHLVRVSEIELSYYFRKGGWVLL
jgi:hypothetical protein